MAGVSLKIDANSKSFQAEMKAMVAQMKLVTSEYKLSAAQAKAMGSSVDALKAKETELTAKIRIQSNIIDAYEGKLKDQKTVLQQLQSEESRLKTKKEELIKAYEDSVRATGEDSEESKKLKAQLQETEQAHAKAEKAVEKQKTAIQGNTTKLYENRAKLNDLNSELQTNQKKLKDAENGMDDFSDEVKDAGKNLEEAGKKAITFGDLIKANVISDFILSGIRALKDGIKSIATTSINTGKDFSSSMSQVAATMGMTAEEIANGSTNFNRLETAARAMGKSTKYSASEAADALNYLALANYGVDDAIETLPTVLNLAAAGNMELADASDMVTDSMSALGPMAGTVESFVDKMAKTSQKSNTSVAQLGEAILTVGGTAKDMAGGVSEMNTVLGILADNGIKGSEGGTALRNMILSLSAPTDKAAQKIEQLGLDVFDTEGKIRPMNQIFKDLNNTLGTMTQEERTQVLDTLFNKVDLKSVNALLANSGERFDELSGYIDDCNGAAANMAETMTANLEGSLASFNSASEDFQIAIYKKIEEPLKGLVDIGTDSVRELTTAFESGGTSGLIKVAGNMISGFINKGLEHMPDLMEMGINAVNSIVQGLNSGNGTMSTAIASLMGTMVSGAGALLPNFLDLGVNMIVSMGNGIASQLPSLVPQVTNIVIQLAGKFIENLPTIVDCGINLIASLVQGIINSIPMLITQVPVLINAFWNTFDGSLGKILLAGGNLIIQLALGIISNLPLVVQNAGEIITAIFNTIMHINFLSAGKTLMTNLKSGISGMKNSLGTAAKELGENALQQIKNINWLNLGRSLVTFIKNGVTGAAGLLWNALKAVGTQGLNAVKNINWLSLGKTVITFVKNGVTGAAGLLGSALKAAGNGAINALKSINFASVGRAIVDGIKSGLKAAASGLISAATGMVSGALKEVKKVLGIASPSRIFKEQVGLMMGAGIELGFEDSMEDARKSMAENMQTLVPDITENVNPVMQVKKYAKITQNDINETRKLTTNDITSRTDETIVINQTNVTYLDGEEISRKTTKKVVKKISRDEKNRKIYKGEFAMA